MNSIVINIILFFLLLYGLNEMLLFTNISSSLDNFLKKYSYKTEMFILLFISMFSSNFDFSNSKIINNKNFYNNGFIMSSLNIISLLSIELFLILNFINSNLTYLWRDFFFLNFFVIIWFLKKSLNIYNDKYTMYDMKKNSFFFKKPKYSTIDFKYNKKYNITKSSLSIAIILNVVLTFLIIYLFEIQFEFHLASLFYINVLLFLFFINLFIYILFIIYKEEHLKEVDFYKRLLESYNSSFSHLFFLFLSLIFLKTNTLIYSNFLNVNQTFTIYIFITILIFILIITWLANSYFLPLTFAIPLILILTNYNVIIFAFFVSFIVIIFFYKNIYVKSFNMDLVLEFLSILILGSISFLIAFLSTTINSYIFIFFTFIIVLIFNKFISNKNRPLIEEENA